MDNRMPNSLHVIASEVESMINDNQPDRPWPSGKWYQPWQVVSALAIWQVVSTFASGVGLGHLASGVDLDHGWHPVQDFHCLQGLMHAGSQTATSTGARRTRGYCKKDTPEGMLMAWQRCQTNLDRRHSRFAFLVKMICW
jgi:hypothetical protein